MRQPKEIEFAFLGCIFDNPSKRIPEALKYNANTDWFSDQSCKLVWTAIETLRKKTPVEKIKNLTIIQKAISIAGQKKSPFYGTKITASFIDEAKRFRSSAEEGEDATIEAYSPVLSDAAIGRRLDSMMDTTRVDGKYTSNTARLLDMSKQLRQIQEDESPEAEIDIANLLDNMNADYAKAYEEFAVKHNYNYIPGIPYPWDCVSHLTGGLNPGLHIIAARPSVGKTSFVLQCCNFWCELGYKVAFNCLDMSVTEAIKRPIANLSWVSPKRLERGWVTPEEQYEVRMAVEKFSNYAKSGLISWKVEYDVDKLKSWAEVRRRAGKLDILVIDFAQRFRLKESSSEYDIATYASGVLKQLANESLIPVVLLSQLSRDNVKDPNGKRPPELSDLRGSGALEQDATTVVLLHKVKEVIDAWRNDPPMYFVQETEDARLTNERASSIAAVCWNLAKNQNGPTGELPFVVFQNCFRWYVGDEDGDKAEMYKRIQADWRFLEEPFVTAEKKGAVVYPSFWPQKCAEMCGKLGVPIPENIKDQLSKWDIDRYNSLLKDHTERMDYAVEAATTPITIEEPPPSVAMITAKAEVDRTSTNVSIQHIEETKNNDIDKKMHELSSQSKESEVEHEPSFEDEFEDENF